MKMSMYKIYTWCKCGRKMFVSLGTRMMMIFNPGWAVQVGKSPDTEVWGSWSP